MIFFLFLLARPSHAQTYELLCPIGSSPLYPTGVTFNTSTGKYRQWQCYDTFGNVTNVVGGTPTSITPNISNQEWYFSGIPLLQSQITLLGSSTGNFNPNHVVPIQIAYNTDATHFTTPSIILNGNTTGCVGTCGIQVTQPAIVPSGYSGVSFYACDQTASPGCTPQLVTGCVNILTSCTVTAPGAGATPLTVSTATTTPPNLQSTECPGGVIPQDFIQTVDGNFHTQTGVDPLSNNISPGGTFEDCRPHWFNDTKTSPPPFNNAMITMAHNYGTRTSTTNQDRTLGLSGATLVGDTTPRYALEVIQAELDYNCATCSITGAPDGEVAVASFQMSFIALQAIGSQLGSNVIRAQWFRQPSALYDTGGMSVLNAIWTNQSTVAAGSSQATGVKVSWNTSATPSGLGFVAYDIVANSGTRFPSFNIGIFAHSGTSLLTGQGTADYFIRNDIRNWQTALNGPVAMNLISESDSAIVPFSMSAQVKGSLQTTPLVAPTITGGLNCTGGATQYFYTFVPIDGNNNPGPSFSSNTAASCVAPLTAPNPVTMSGIQGIPPAVKINIYRTAGGAMSTGLIGSLTGCVNIFPNTCNSFVDTGLAGDSSTAPTIDQTSGFFPAWYSAASLCTSAASPAVCGTAPTGAVVIAAAATTVQVNTTRVGANTGFLLTEDSSLGARLGVTCNATPNAVRVTARSVGVSFTITAAGAPAVNPNCYSWMAIGQ